MVDVVTDPLDGSVWVWLGSASQAQQASVALVRHGIVVVDRRDARLQVSGWDPRVLRRRLGTAMAGVDDLRAERTATAELARCHRDRRREVTGADPDPVEVLGDVERTLREAQPLPHVASATSDVETLLTLVEAAEDAYAQLLTSHVEHAAAVLEADRTDHAGGRSDRRPHPGRRDPDLHRRGLHPPLTATGARRAARAVDPGDTIVVWRLDRLARSLRELIDLVNDFGRRGVGLRSLTDQLDTTTPGGRFLFHVFGAMAEL